MVSLWKAGATARLVLVWNAWLTAVLAGIFFGPSGPKPGLAVVLVVSWGVTAFVHARAIECFGSSLEANAPEFAREIRCARPFWLQPFLARRLASLTLVKAVRRDPDLGVPARVYALAYWYPLALFILMLPGFTYLATR